MSFDDLKKNSGTAALQKLTQQLQEINKKREFTDKEDTRYWKLARDKSGNGNAVIRFLPSAEGEDFPWVKLFKHSFQGPGGMWYIENSLTTLNQKDPVSEYNRELWNSGVEYNKKLASKNKRKEKYVSNIYVVKDPSNPDNEGKVFLFEYGKKIFGMLNSQMHPENTEVNENGDNVSISETDPAFKKPYNPFDLWEGANFQLVARQVEGFTNYDTSRFGKQSAFGQDDQTREHVWKQCYSLQELLDTKHFKTYDVLKARLDKVLNTISSDSATAPTVSTGKFAKPKSVEIVTSDEEPQDLSFLSRMQQLADD